MQLHAEKTRSSCWRDKTHHQHYGNNCRYHDTRVVIPSNNTRHAAIAHDVVDGARIICSRSGRSSSSSVTARRIRRRRSRPTGSMFSFVLLVASLSACSISINRHSLFVVVDAYNMSPYFGSPPRRRTTSASTKTSSGSSSSSQPHHQQQQHQRQQKQRQQQFITSTEASSCPREQQTTNLHVVNRDNSIRGGKTSSSRQRGSGITSRLGRIYRYFRYPRHAERTSAISETPAPLFAASPSPLMETRPSGSSSSNDAKIMTTSTTTTLLLEEEEEDAIVQGAAMAILHAGGGDGGDDSIEHDAGATTLTDDDDDNDSLMIRTGMQYNAEQQQQQQQQPEQNVTVNGDTDPNIDVVMTRTSPVSSAPNGVVNGEPMIANGYKLPPQQASQSTEEEDQEGDDEDVDDSAFIVTTPTPYYRIKGNRLEQLPKTARQGESRDDEAVAQSLREQHQYENIEARAGDDKTNEHQLQQQDDDAYMQEKKDSKSNNFWRRRNARSAEEGIRREKTEDKTVKKTEKIHRRRKKRLSSLLAQAIGTAQAKGRQFAARTVTGLLTALADEVEDLQVRVDTRHETPMWNKHVESVRVQFSRLGFKPLRMGGIDRVQEIRDVYDKFISNNYTYYFANTESNNLTDLICADTAFDRIDVDKSGALDRDEIAEALNLAVIGKQGNVPLVDQPTSVSIVKDIASDLVSLYDSNGDGVLQREEYQSMVEDMAALRTSQEERETNDNDRGDGGWSGGWFSSVKNYTVGLLAKVKNDDDKKGSETIASESYADANSMETSVKIDENDSGLVADGNDFSTHNTEALGNIMSKTLGSITLLDLKLDLRRIFFGAIPLIKHITPGGPLILEPFTVTINGSWNANDILDSTLLDAGLRMLVRRALRRRARSFRDVVDLAVFRGRSWKMFDQHAPFAEVPELTNIEFDDNNKLIITGRAIMRTAPGAPIVENAFKVRTKIGTRQGGRFIRLVEPELALVLECPSLWEENMARAYSELHKEMPPRPQPLYFFIPLYSPFKVDDNDGFDLGEDNCIKSIYVEDKALKFELESVLRPGRFLGNHYVAFTLPIRTFIITLDRVKEGIRAARRQKQAKRALQKAHNDVAEKEGARPPVDVATNSLESIDAQQNSSTQSLPPPPPKSFFSRFVDGYMQLERENVKKERVMSAIRDWFGQQIGSSAEEDGETGT